MHVRYVLYPSMDIHGVRIGITKNPWKTVDVLRQFTRNSFRTHGTPGVVYGLIPYPIVNVFPIVGSVGIYNVFLEISGLMKYVFHPEDCLKLV